MSSPFQWSSLAFSNAAGRTAGQPTQYGANGRMLVQTDSAPSQMFGAGRLPSATQNYAPPQGAPISQNRSMFGGGDMLTGNTMQPRFATTQGGTSSSRFGGDQGPAAGDYVTKALIGDYLSKKDATGRMRADYDRLFKNLDKTGEQARQGLDMAKQSGQRQLDFAKQGKDELMAQAGKMDEVYKKAQEDAKRSLGEARSQMQEAIDKQDFFRKDTVAGGVNAIMSNFNSFKEQVMSGAGEFANYSDADKKAAIDEAHRSMESQRASYAADADSKAADALANMRMTKGSTMGQLGLSAAGLTAQVGTSRAQMGMAAAEEAWRGMQAANQFDAAITQQANAQLIKANMDNDEMRAGLIKMYPYSGPNMADTILAIMNSQGMKPGSRVTDSFGREMGSLIGVPGFAGYA